MDNTFSSVSKGTIGVAHCIAHLSQQGYIVSLPINDNQPYDLLYDDHTAIRKVSVKFTSQTNKNGCYIVELKSVRPNRTKNTIHKFDNNLVDDVFIFCTNGDKYLIPCNEITVSCAMTLDNTRDKWRTKC